MRDLAFGLRFYNRKGSNRHYLQCTTARQIVPCILHHSLVEILHFSLGFEVFGVLIYFLQVASRERVVASVLDISGFLSKQ